MILKTFIVKEWLKAFFAALVALFVIMSVTDLIGGFLRSNVTPTEVLFNYLFTIPKFMSKALPVACLMGTLFSINKLKSHSELIAILAAGFSGQTIVNLIFGCSLMATLAQGYILGELIPYSKIVRLKMMPDSLKGKFSENKEKGLKTSSLATGLIWYKSHNYYVSFSAFNKKTSELINMTLYMFEPNYLGNKTYKAPLVSYAGNYQWKMINGREFSDLNSLQYPNGIAFKEKTIKLTEEVQDFDQIESDIETLGVFGLFNFISHIKNSGINIREYEVLFYEMFSMSLICLVFGLFPASAIFDPNRRNSSFGKSVVFTLAFTITYLVIYSAVVSLGTTGHLPVPVAVFIVPVVSLLYCQIVFLKKRKL
ncbi:MAG: LptF/LptG family permease [Bacteriovoracaceae bacterium]